MHGPMYIKKKKHVMYFVSYENIRNQHICSIKSTSNSYSLVIVSPKWKYIKLTSHTCIYPCEYEVIKLSNLLMFLSAFNISQHFCPKHSGSTTVMMQ